MASERAHDLELPYCCSITVHKLMCLELKILIDRISEIISDMEFSRPRCSAGLQALCSLHSAMDKAKLLIQHCSDCSKLYLALTGDRILLRCENVRNSLHLCLIQIQNNVPTLLAAKISGIVEDLKAAKFTIEPSEDEAGKFIKQLLKLNMPASDSINESELKVLRFAATRLKINSPLAVLVEERLIKKLHGKVREARVKKKILEYFLYLLRKYREQIAQLKSEDDPALNECKTQTGNSATPEPPLSFMCPISKRLMYDPVIIDSGQTFERFWIEQWFREGNDQCPATNVKLENLSVTPNDILKCLISKWCSQHGITVSEPCAQSTPAPDCLQKLVSTSSIASFTSSMNDLHLQVGNISPQSSNLNLGSDSLDDVKNANSGAVISAMNASIGMKHTGVSSMNLMSLPEIQLLPWESQCKAVHDIKKELKKNKRACDWMLSDNLMKLLVQFLVDAVRLNDVQAQTDSADILLSVLSKSRIELPSLDKDAIFMLASCIDSEISERALEVMEELSSKPFYKSRIVASGVLPAILKVLESHIAEFRELAMKIICNLTDNIEAQHHIVYLDCIPKLVPFLRDRDLAAYCLSIMKTLCGTDHGIIAIAESSSCIAAIATLVETGTEYEQETAMKIWHSMC